MSEWIVPANLNKYKADEALRELKIIDWKQSSNVEIGDIIYLYISNPVQAIQFKCKANKVDMNTIQIDDSKFYVGEDFSNNDGRFMEIELLDEYSISLLKINNMENYGFKAPQGPIRVTQEMAQYLSLVQKLINSKELEPDEHDGSYRLMRETIEAYKKMSDISSCDFKDLNLVYQMSIGTWSQGIDKKQETIRNSHLPSEEKNRLIDLIQSLWKNAQEFKYSNEEIDVPSFGMFGTGFFSFGGKTSTESTCDFIQMCIDISAMDDDEKIYATCEKILNKGINGMQAASASMILHCLKPFTFPILNNNQGSNNIFQYFNIPINEVNKLNTYIDNCRKIKEFRDENFKIKNFRIFDKIAWQIDNQTQKTDIDYISVLKYLENHKGLTYSNPSTEGLTAKEIKNYKALKKKGQKATLEIKKMAKICKNKFDLKQSGTTSWLDGSFSKIRDYLWVQMKYDRHIKNPISISIFAEMSQITHRPRYRFSLEIKNQKASVQNFQKYHTFLDIPIRPESSLVYVTMITKEGRPEEIHETANAIKEKLQNGTYTKVQISRIVDIDDKLSNNDYENLMIESIKELIPYYEHVVEENSMEKNLKIKSANERVEDNKIQYDKNLILFGPPGTGKTYSSIIYAVAICDSKQIKDLTDYDYVLNRYKELKEEGRVAFTTFHQSYSYEEFIEGIKPVIDKKSNNISYKTEPGIFKEFCDEASSQSKEITPNPDGNTNRNSIESGKRENIKPYVFIIDEINRGNISKIFGELITLIENTKRSGMPEELFATLPYSKKPFSVPQNVYIVGTMNTADRSIALIDTALRRRFKFVEMMPDTKVLRDNQANKVQDLDIDKMLEKINERITYLYDREHTIGHSFFMGLKGKNATVENLQSVFQESIIPLLQEYFYDDYQKIQLVLGDNEKSSTDYKFILDEKVMIKEIFKGNAEDEVDLPEKTYRINTESFSKIESYKEIIS